MSRHSDASDDLSYEDFDDVTWTDDDDLDAINLDALDDDIEDENAATSADKPDTAPTRPQPKTAPPRRAASTRARAAAVKPAPTSKDAAPDDTPAATAPTTSDAKPAATAPTTPPAALKDTPTPAAAKSDAPTEAAPQDEAQGDTDTPPPEPEPDWVYQVLIALPDDLSAQVIALRVVGEINDVPPPGIMLGGAFRTPQLDAVQDALAHWTRNHLPLQIERVGIWAEVVGKQQYIAAWRLQPDEELQEALHNLRRALAPLITPLPDARTAIQVHLAISEHVPAHRYPHLIGHMQREFEPYVWHANDLLLVRRNADAKPDTNTSDPLGWETATTYN
ncbi:MAG: hypothetical protein K8S97_01405 [Anaerolineae bacterium]|nr:hypothetical protein [Anaerolineae bacterium]